MRGDECDTAIMGDNTQGHGCDTATGDNTQGIMDVIPPLGITHRVLHQTQLRATLQNAGENFSDL